MHIPQHSEQSLAQAVHSCFHYIYTCSDFKLSCLFFPLLVYCLTPPGNTNSPQQPPCLPCSLLPASRRAWKKTPSSPDGAGTGLSPYARHLPVQMDKVRQGRGAGERRPEGPAPPRQPYPETRAPSSGFRGAAYLVPGARVFLDATGAIAQERRFGPLGPLCANKGLSSQTRTALAEALGLRSAARAPAGRGRWGSGGAPGRTPLRVGVDYSPGRGAQEPVPGGAKVTRPISRGTQLP